MKNYISMSEMAWSREGSFQLERLLMMTKATKGESKSSEFMREGIELTRIWMALNENFADVSKILFQYKL